MRQMASVSRLIRVSTEGGTGSPFLEQPLRGETERPPEREPDPALPLVLRGDGMANLPLLPWPESSPSPLGLSASPLGLGDEKSPNPAIDAGTSAVASNTGREGILLACQLRVSTAKRMLGFVRAAAAKSVLPLISAARSAAQARLRVRGDFVFADIDCLRRHDFVQIT